MVFCSLIRTFAADMKKIVYIIMVVLLAACGGQSSKTESEKKDSIVTARDVAMMKKAEAEQLLDSLRPALETAIQEEKELADWVIAHAVELKDDAPEVLRLNRIRMHLDTLHRQVAVTEGQVRYLKRQLKIED